MAPLDQAPISKDAHDFLLEEYKALRKEIEIEIQQFRNYLQSGILGSGAIWAWLLSHKEALQTPWAYSVPFFLSVLLFIQISGLRKKVYTIGSYIGRIEDAFRLPYTLGWDRHLERGLIKRDQIPMLETAIWIGLCVGNFLGGAYSIEMAQGKPSAGAEAHQAAPKVTAPSNTVSPNAPPH